MRKLILKRLPCLLVFAALLPAAGSMARTGGGYALAAPEGREADPGELVTYCFALTGGGALASLGISYESSAGWTVLTDAARVSAGDGGEALVALSLIVPADAPAGAVDVLSLVLTDGEGRETARASVSTTVRPRADFELCAPDPVTAGAGSAIVLSFSLANLGNVRDVYDCEAYAGGGWRADPPSAAIALAPLKAGSLDLSVRVPAGTAAGGSGIVTVIARSRSTGVAREASARVIVGIAPAEGVLAAGEDCYRLSGEAGISAALPHASAGSLSAWLRLAGPLESDRWLELRLETADLPGGSEPSKMLLSYRTPAYQLRAGGFDSPWSGTVRPGTDRAALDLIYGLDGRDRLRLTMGTAGVSGLSLEPAWYGLEWSRGGAGSSLAVRLLRTDAGLNAGGAYIDASLDRRAPGRFFSADLALGLGDLSSAGSLYYGRREGRFGWYEDLSWSDRINGDGFSWSSRAGGSYSWRGRRLGVNLGLSHGGADLPDPAYYYGRAEITFLSGRGLSLRAAANGDWSDRGVWREDRSGWLLGMDYGSFALGGGPVSASLDLEGERLPGEPVRYDLVFEGDYRFGRAPAPPGWFHARLKGRAGLGASPAVSDARLSLDYEGTAGSLDYALGLAADYPGPGLGVDVDLAYDNGLDTSFAGSLRWSAGGIGLRLQIARRFDLALPRPHGTVSGVIFQDLNGDGRRDPGEPGIFGAGVLLDGEFLGEVDAEGRFVLVGVSPGPHGIGADCGFDPSLRGQPGQFMVEPEAGVTVNVDIPVVRLTILSGLVFEDVDGDGLRGPGEAPLPGVPVILTGPGGYVRTVESGPCGEYAFPDLPPGSYRLATDSDGLPGEAALPVPVDMNVSQEGGLCLDLPVVPRARPAAMTYIALPGLSVSVSPGEAAPGGAVVLEIDSVRCLTRIAVECAGGVLADSPADGNSWTGSIVIPVDWEEGETELIVKVWNGGEEPVAARLRLVIKKAIGNRQ